MSFHPGLPFVPTRSTVGIAASEISGVLDDFTQRRQIEQDQKAVFDRAMELQNMRDENDRMERTISLIPQLAQAFQQPGQAAEAIKGGDFKQLDTLERRPAKTTDKPLLSASERNNLRSNFTVKSVQAYLKDLRSTGERDETLLVRLPPKPTATTNKKKQTLGGMTADQRADNIRLLSPRKDPASRDPQTPQFVSGATQISGLSEQKQFQRAERLGLNDQDLDNISLVKQDVLDYFEFKDRQKPPFLLDTFQLTDRQIVKLVKAGLTIEDVQEAIKEIVENSDRTPNEVFRILLSRL